MVGLEIPELEQAMVGEIAEVGDWVVANLETSISWPVSYQRHEFDGSTFFIVPLTKNHFPAIAVLRGARTPPQARSALLRFLSALCWAEAAGAIVVSFSGGGLPRPAFREKSFGHTITADLNLAYLPAAIDARGRLALGLMREGRGLNHPAYAFLSFYRVLEAALPDGKAREAWVAGNIDAMLDRGAIEALAALRAAGTADVGAHLYRSGRMAIAHARADPIINPDDASDYDRIAAELPVMRGLAELAIEAVIGIETRHTAYRLHRYELAGFRDRFGMARCAAFDARLPPAEGDRIDLPTIDVELRRREPFGAFRSMKPIHASQDGGSLQLVYRSQDELVDFGFVLDFAAERLRFEWHRDVACRNDGSADAARHAAEINRFILEYVGNGELHLYDSETRDLLSRVDAFVPVNYWADHDALTSRIAEWHAEAERRRDVRVR